MTLWFSGCTHFDHQRIITLAKRPFATVEEMNETMIENWNGSVKRSDDVYLLGDICWPLTDDDERDPEPWLDRLNGRKTIIWGNHDDRSLTPDSKHASGGCHDYLEVKYNHTHLVLFHYPIDDWNGRYKGWIHLHCHDHLPTFRNPRPPAIAQSGLELGKPVRYPDDLHCNRFRVGQDACGFRPVSFEEIMENAKTP